MTGPQLIIVAAVLAVVVIAVVRFEVLCLTDISHTSDADLRYLTRRGWIAVCLLSIPLGGVAYLYYGKFNRFR